MLGVHRNPAPNSREPNSSGVRPGPLSVFGHCLLSCASGCPGSRPFEQFGSPPAAAAGSRRPGRKRLRPLRRGRPGPRGGGAPLSLCRLCRLEQKRERKGGSRHLLHEEGTELSHLCGAHPNGSLQTQSVNDEELATWRPLSWWSDRRSLLHCTGIWAHLAGNALSDLKPEIESSVRWKRCSFPVFLHDHQSQRPSAQLCRDVSQSLTRKSEEQWLCGFLPKRRNGATTRQNPQESSGLGLQPGALDVLGSH